jgi:ribose/xylose/arabinose/galactoside ABC-type transport system permease subunit
MKTNMKVQGNARVFGRVDLATSAPILFLLLLMIVYSIFAKNFLGVTNFVNILRQVSITGILAMGVTLVILVGEIDLSIATVMAFSGMIAAGLSKGEYFHWPEMPVGIGILAVIVIGAMIGFVTGWTNAKLGIPGFMASLAMQFVCGGLMLMLTKAKPIFSLKSELTYLGSGYLLPGVPVIILVFILLFIVGHVVLKYTVFGRNLYAIGGNNDAARMSGINVAGNKITAFMICSVLASIAGVLMVGRIGSAQVTAGDGLQMQPIAGAVLGGASLFGGKGTMMGTLLGVLIMGVLVNGLNLLGAGSEIQRLVTGLILFLAVAFNIWSSRKAGLE